MVPLRITATDDQGVDRVAVQLDGRVQGVDWTAADGWTIDVTCSSGTRVVTAWAYDAADNEGGGRIQQRIDC